MKAIFYKKRWLLCVLLVVAFGVSNHVQAQTKNNKKVAITITTTDDKGNTTIEKIEKSGAEASEEAIDAIIQEALKSSKSIDVEVEQTEQLEGDKGITKTIEKYANREVKEGEGEMEIQIELDEEGNIITEKIIGKEVRIIKIEGEEDIDVDKLLEEQGIDLTETDGTQKRIRIIKTEKKEKWTDREDVEEKLKKIGIVLPTPTPPAANYVNAVRSDKLIFMAGKGPTKPEGGYVTGKVGRDLTEKEGYAAARLVGIAQLAALKAEIGDLNRVKRIVKVLGMVNATSEFTNHPEVVNGFSDLMVEVFGDRGKHARAAVGMHSLPRNIAVEIEMIVEIE